MIKVETLDSVFSGREKPISLIKVDVEGFELGVLKGGFNILKKYRPRIIMEINKASYSMKDILLAIPYPVNVFFIDSNNYSLTEIHENYLASIRSGSDVLFVRK